MKYEDKKRMIEICNQIRDDAENDARDFDGKPFTGKVLGEYLGNHGASIATLSDLIKKIIEDD